MPGRDHIFRKPAFLWVGLGVVATLGFGVWQSKNPARDEGSTASLSDSRLPSQGHGGGGYSPFGGKKGRRKSGSSEGRDGITPEEGRRLLELARSNPDVMTRSAECIAVIGRLCEAGYVEEAWSLIDEKPGQVRDSELLKFFKSASLDTPELISKIQSLPHPMEARNALWGHFVSLDEQATRGLLEDPAFKNLIQSLDKSSPGILARALATSLVSRVGNPGDTASKLEARDLAVRFHADGLLNSDQLAQVIKADNVSAGFDKWPLVAGSLKDARPGTTTDDVRKNVIEQMINEDAPKALDELVKVQGGQGFKDIITGVKKWAVIDSTAADEWYAAQAGRLNQSQRDGVAFGFYQIALDLGEREGAEKWANEIAHSELKKKALAKLPARPAP